MGETEKAAVNPTTGIVTATVELDLQAMLDYRRGLVRRREYVPLGKLEKVMLDAGGIEVQAGNRLRGKKNVSASLDWYGHGPLLALSRDREDVLVVGPMVHPPPLPDPNWLPPPDWYVRQQEAGKPPLPPKPPLVEQRLRDRAYGVLRGKGEEWVLFQPVHQLLLVLHDKTGWGVVQCSADFAGKHTALLYNPKTQEAHFLFGSKQVDVFTK